MPSEPRIAPRAGVLDHLSARLHSRDLDQALARGTPPESAAPLALRARRLTALPRRRVIAAGLRRVIRETCGRAPASQFGILPRRAQVAAASDELTRLAEDLVGLGPVAARGTAEAWILLTDGTGPLYNPDSTVSLRASAVSAANGLRLTG
jgi:hypothetical protein